MLFNNAMKVTKIKTIITLYFAIRKLRVFHIFGITSFQVKGAGAFSQVFQLAKCSPILAKLGKVCHIFCPAYLALSFDILVEQ